LNSISLSFFKVLSGGFDVFCCCQDTGTCGIELYLRSGKFSRPTNSKAYPKLLLLRESGGENVLLAERRVVGNGMLEDGR
jgi:hypothetical protein